MIGTTLGPYHVLEKLGEGGMGEVYKARDTRLGRTVALKLLPAAVMHDADLRARFKREAETIAAVNDPHICALYDVTHHGDHDVLVMEYVEGETLQAVLARGRLPLSQALTVALHIARALETAHRSGIVHRDLKPSNIMIARSGAKLMDFGIAKLRAPPSPEHTEATRGATLTQRGSIVGTVGYMAPEQLQGGDTDARADVFAFGAVLFEMLTGRPAYDAPGDLSIQAPPVVRLLIRRCLERDREARWRSAHDAAAIIKSALESPEQPDVRAARTSRFVPLAGLALLTVALGAAVVWLLVAGKAAPARVSRLSVVPPPGVTLRPIDVSGAPQFALSPDGDSLAMVAAAPGERFRLYVRSLTTGVTRALSGTDGAAGPFWSPDGNALGFFARGKLKTIELSGERVLDLADVTFDVIGGSWAADGILYGFSDGSPIHFVAATGGTPRPVTTFDKDGRHTAHRRPEFLPDGKHFVFFVSTEERERSGVYYASLDSPTARFVMASDAHAVSAAPDWLFFARGGGLVAQRFSTQSGALVGEPIALPDRVTALPGPSALMVSASPAGTLAYWSGGGPPSRLEWFDRSGRPAGSLVPAASRYFNPMLSRDGQQVLVTRRETPEDPTAVWSIDVATGRMTRLTFVNSGGTRAIWAPDATRIVFAGLLGGRARVFTKPASGAGADEEVFTSSGRYVVFPTDWSESAQWIVCQATSAQGWDLLGWSVAEKKLRPLIEAPGNQTNGRVSPNGKWLAYASDESGTWQVYVQPFLSSGGKWQVSEGSGSQPLWRADGQELYYIDDDGLLMAARVRADVFDIVDRQPLFRARVQPPLAPFPTSFAVTPDGQRFLVNQMEDRPAVPITVLSNWRHELERR